ncbi:hypothetical protein HN51_000988 [Arachis hypogaea]
MLSPNRLMKLLIPSLTCSLCVALHPSFNSPRFWDLLPRPTIAPPPFPFFSNCNPGFCKFQSFTIIQSQTEQSFIKRDFLVFFFFGDAKKMEKKREIVELYRKRLDNTLASPHMTNYHMLKNLVQT